MLSQWGKCCERKFRKFPGECALLNTHNSQRQQQQQADVTHRITRHLPFFPVHEKNQNSSASNQQSNIGENTHELRSMTSLLYV